MLNTLGAKNAALIVYRHEWWRLLTPMLLHAGLIHLAVNVLIQLRVGVMLELEWGLKRYAAIYVTSGLTSSLLSCLALPDTLGVGCARFFLLDNRCTPLSPMRIAMPRSTSFRAQSLSLSLSHSLSLSLSFSPPQPQPNPRSSGALMGVLGAWLVELCCKWSSSTPEELPQVCGPTARPALLA